MDTQVPEPTNNTIIGEKAPIPTTDTVNTLVPKPTQNNNGLFVATLLSLLTFFIAPVIALIGAIAGGGINSPNFANLDAPSLFIIFIAFCPLIALTISLYKYLKGNHSSNVYASISIAVISMIVFFLTLGRLFRL